MSMGKRTGGCFHHYFQIFSWKPHSFPGDCFDGKEPEQKNRLSSTSFSPWRCACNFPHRFAMNDPIVFPNAVRNVIKKIRLFQRIPEFCPKDHRQRLNRNKEFHSGGKPLAAVGRQSTTGYDIVDMGVVAHIALPGMQSTHHTDVTADEPGIFGQFLQCRRRGLKQQIVDCLLVRAGHRPEFNKNIASILCLQYILSASKIRRCVIH
jgi:hypothetical protein